MNEILNEEIKIENLIYEIRGKQVMLDSDLARLYQCKNGTKDINKAVKRNIERFPQDFYFQLTDMEYKYLKFHFGTSNLNNHGGRRYNPYVFTEQGVAMLASVLRTDIANKVSIKIMRAFVIMRRYVSDNLLEQKYINNLVLEHDKNIKCLEESFKQLEEKRKSTEIYFEGQIYDAYYKIQEIFKEAKQQLIIIDAYADNTILDIIKRLKVKVIIITKAHNLLTRQDIEKYHKQYKNLEVSYINNFHDRYFLIDENVVYHCGASINRIGYKTFSITKISDKEVIELLFKKVNLIIKQDNL